MNGKGGHGWGRGVPNRSHPGRHIGGKNLLPGVFPAAQSAVCDIFCPSENLLRGLGVVFLISTGPWGSPVLQGSPLGPQKKQYKNHDF